MDSFNRKDVSNRVKSMYPSVFPSRPWMMNVGAAAPAGDGNKGLKGVVAGKSSITKNVLTFYQLFMVVTVWCISCLY